MDRLNLASLDRVPAPARPSPDPRELSIGIVHLGLGSFHRAHQALYTERAMALSGERGWGICGVTQRSARAAEALVPQDCLYSVLASSPAGSSITVAGAVREAIFAVAQPGELLERLASPATAVVTLTVTEKGYRYNPATGGLQNDDPELLLDAAGRPPKTVLGQLAAGLAERMRQGSPPLSVVCCDNMPGNGERLRRLVESYCRLLPAGRGNALAAWVEANVAFPSTVVDRIVPAATDDDRARASELLGLEDRAAVVTEPFSQWVIEDSFAGARPAWERAGAELVADVAPYEQIKLRLLNGSHSALAYLGALAGHELIADAVAAPGFERYVRALMDKDMSPTLSPPAGFDLPGYKSALIERFANPVLRHRTTQVAMDGTQKLPYRLLAPVLARLSAGAEARHACLAVAAWMRYVSAGENDKGERLPLEDPLASRLRSAAAGASTPSAVVGALLALREVFPPELAEDARFRRALIEDLSSLSRRGAGAVVADWPEGR
jgi:fructuronate reductase